MKMCKFTDTHSHNASALVVNIEVSDLYTAQVEKAPTGTAAVCYKAG